MVSSHIENVFDTVRGFLDTCPDLEGAEIECGETLFSVPLFWRLPERFRAAMCVEIDGHRYCVSVSRLD